LELNLSSATLLTGELQATERTEPVPVERIAPLFPQLEILEYLGRGGMGIVYKARQLSLDRLVALKILAPQREKEAQFAERFAREAQALARLSHPHIVTVHDFGEAKMEDGAALYFLLMEFVDGVNLRQVLRTRRLQSKEALAIVPPICEALQYAHDRGIVHRDIKPENLLLDKDGRVKIADFGIAKMVGTGAGEEEKSAGTPEYMAPEQQTAPESADHRADIYSLGVVLYEMLTGELPSRKLEPTSARLRQMQLDVRLDEVVLRALHTEPELRYRTALDLKTQIELVAAERSAAHLSDPRTPSAIATKKSSLRSTDSNETGLASKRTRRRRMIWVALLFVFLPASLAVTSWIWPRRYFSRVMMEVRSDKAQDMSAAEVQIVSTGEILYPVIEQLGLYNVFSQTGLPLSRSEIYTRLRRSLEIRPVRNTSLIEIGVYSASPQLAANVANTIALVYRTKRIERFHMSTAALQRQVDEQRTLFHQTRAEMLGIKERDGIIDPDPERADVSPTATNDSGDTGPYVAAKTRYLIRKKALEEAEVRRATQIDSLDFDPVRIWEKAEPAPYGVRVGLRRLWNSL